MVSGKYLKPLGGVNMEKEIKIDNYGVVKIADDVVALIAELAAKEVKGVIAMSGGIADSITEILGKKKNRTFLPRVLRLKLAKKKQRLIYML